METGATDRSGIPVVNTTCQVVNTVITTTAEACECSILSRLDGDESQAVVLKDRAHVPKLSCATCDLIIVLLRHQ